MKKRLLAALLAALTLISLPLAASAAVLSGNTSKVDYDNTDPGLYWIEIDLTNQVITVYQTATGAVMVQSLCTTGSDELPTGAGDYTVGDLKERFGYFVAYGQYAQYWTQVVRGVYIHSVMYDSKKLSSMSKSAYRNLGKNVSHGCVRVLPHVAQWIFYNCPPGTVCKITGAKAKDEALVKTIKAGIPAYGDYTQPTDAKADPTEIPATVKYGNTPLRTGFSASKDTTVATLGAGAHVLLLQIGADWCKVRTAEGKLGYIKTQYLLFNPDETPRVQESYAATQKTYLYASAGTDSEKLATIASGSAVDSVSESGKSGWYNAAFNGKQGFVRSKYVKLTTTVAYPALQTAEQVVTMTAADGTAVTTTATATVTATRADRAVNLRAGPGTQTALVATLPASTPVSVISMEGEWYYCTAGNMTGWLHISCLG